MRRIKMKAMRRKNQRRPRATPSKWTRPVYRDQAISEHWHEPGEVVVGFGMFYMKRPLTLRFDPCSSHHDSFTLIQYSRVTQ